MLYPVPIFRAVNELLAIVVTFGRLIVFRVLALELALVVPVAVIERPLTVVAVEVELALVKVKLARLELVEVKEESVNERALPEAVAEVILAVPEVWIYPVTPLSAPAPEITIEGELRMLL